MGVSLKPDHLRRYRDLATLLLKYGRSDLLTSGGLEPLLEADPDDSKSDGLADTGRRLADDLERRGPTFVKFGQLLSTRPDIVAPEVAGALGRLQNDLEPFPFADVERIVQEELGVRLSKAFSKFERTPIAAASLGQVHRAWLRDGRAVAIKIQRPGIRAEVVNDLDTLDDLAELADQHTEAGSRYQVAQLVAGFRRALLNELDYRREARNQVLIGRALQGFPRIIIPQPIEDYSTSRVLTMDFVRGSKITTLSPVVRLEADGEALASELLRAYLHQIVVEGFFHADPHPGNVLLTDDGRLALIDLGMVSDLPGTLQESLLKLLMAVSEGQGERAADLVMEMGEARADADLAGYRRDIAALVARHRHASLQELQAGRTVLLLARIAADHGIRLPNEMALLGKTLLNLDEIARTLAPEFAIDDVLRDNVADLMRQRMLKSLTPAAAFTSALELKDLMQQLPGRINRLLDVIARQEVKVKVEMVEEGAVMQGLQKVANRITLGLLLAALIIAAGMLMRVPTDFRLLGYPGLAMIFFLGAAAGAFWLAFTIVGSDRRPKA